MKDFNFLKDYNGILAKILIMNENGNEICYINEFEIIKEIAVKSDKDSYTTSLNIGDRLHFSDGDFIVKKISTHFINETDTEYMNYGVNLYGIGEQLPFNFQITYTVAEA